MHGIYNSSGYSRVKPERELLLVAKKEGGIVGEGFSLHPTPRGKRGGGVFCLSFNREGGGIALLCCLPDLTHWVLHSSTAPVQPLLSLSLSETGKRSLFPGRMDKSIRRSRRHAISHYRSRVKSRRWVTSAKPASEGKKEGRVTRACPRQKEAPVPAGEGPGGSEAPPSRHLPEAGCSHGRPFAPSEQPGRKPSRPPSPPCAGS